MYYSRRLLIAMITCLSTFQLYSSTTTDSLLQKIDHTSGKEKLELIYQLALSQQDTKELLKTAKLLEKESERLENIKYIMYSYNLQLKYFAYENKIDSLLFYTKKIKDLSLKNKIEDQFNDLYFLAFSYFNIGYYDLAIYNLNLLLENSDIKNSKKKESAVYNLLGHAYFKSKRYELAKENFQKNIDVSLTANIDDPTFFIGLYNNLILCLIYLGEYDQAFEKCKIYEAMLNEKMDKLSPTQKNLFELMLYNVYGYLYTCLKDTKHAKLYLDKIDNLYLDDNISEVLKFATYETRARYLYLLEEYTNALNYIDEALEFYTQNNLSSDQNHMDLLLLKIDILKKQGRYKDIVDLQSSIISYNDSISSKNIPLQISQLSKEYELEKAKIKEEKEKVKLERTQILVIGLAIIVILLIIILYTVKRNTKKLKEKNLILFRKNQDLEKYTSPRLKISTEEEKVKNISLFDRIEAYILESEIFKDSALTRDDVAAALNTNRQYLTDAIKDETGKAFLDYINQFRLNYVYHQLVSSDESIPVNSIMYEAGFSSSSTFYRLFKEKFGMSPNEVRQAKADLKLQESKDKQIDNSF